MARRRGKYAACGLAEGGLGDRLQRGLIFSSIAVAGAAIAVLLGAPWTAILAWLRDHWPVADAAIGLTLGVVAAVIWLALGAPTRSLDVTSINLTLPGLGEIEIGLSRQEQLVLWRLFVELTTRVVLQPLRPDQGSLAEAMSSLHDFFGVAREQLAQVPVRSAAQGKDSAQVLILRILNRELRPFLTQWHPKLTAAIAAGASETSWPETAACRADLESTRLRVLDIAWQLGDALGVGRLPDVLPPRASPAAP